MPRPVCRTFRLFGAAGPSECVPGPLPSADRARDHMTTTPAGRPSPLGASVADGGVNFSLYSRTATGVELQFFDREDAGPVLSVTLDPVANRTYHYWHAFVPGVRPRQLYGYRV